MAMNYTITARCENGHTQRVVMDGLLGVEWVKVQSALLDGTSRFYLQPPGLMGVITRCGICGNRIHCEVTDAEPRADMTGVEAGSGDFRHMR